MRLLNFIFLITFSCGAFALSLTERAQGFLELYSQDREAARRSMPAKHNIYKGKEVPVGSGYHVKGFKPEDVITGSYIGVKSRERDKIIKRASSPDSMETFSGWLTNDDPFRFIDGGPYGVIVNLNEMEVEVLQSSSLSKIPWSDDYWAIDGGILGARYSDHLYWMKMGWINKFKHIAENPLPKMYTSADLKMLSPSEKYDLLVGDQEEYEIEVDGGKYSVFGSLTYRMWAEGAYYYNQNGEVETWMGICHGWAAASYMMSHPSKSVKTVDLLEGKELHFYPSDIKSLASLLWANTKVPSKFIGGRCNSKEPTRDNQGRLNDPECLDTNPGTWHIVVVNQIAKQKRSFIMDATFDYQVWNQPVSTYKYEYFNPVTKESNSSLSLNQANTPLVELANWKEDPYKKHRHPNAKYVVGIAMEIGYVVENQPAALDLDLQTDEYITRVDYIYDLELDENLNIIGGEWYQNLHPDFLWSPPKGYRAMALGDYYMQGVWENGKVSSFVRDNPQAKKLVKQSSLLGQPLAQIVEALIEAAQGAPVFD